jgi:hypothetical protein
MTINQLPLTPVRWRRLHPHLRAELLHALGGKAAIIGRPVLDVTNDLCARSGHGLALALYDGLRGDPPPEYEECGSGAMMRLLALLGEDRGRHDTWLYGSEEAPLLLRTRYLSREART